MNIRRLIGTTPYISSVALRSSTRAAFLSQPSSFYRVNPQITKTNIARHQKPYIGFSVRQTSSMMQEKGQIEPMLTVPDTSKCGHVFVLRTSAEGLAADAILVSGNTDQIDQVRMKNVKTNEGPCFYEAALDKLDSTNNIENCISAIFSFAQQAAEYMEGKDSRYRRGKPLIAMPIPGLSGDTNVDDKKSNTKLLKSIFPRLYAIVNRYGVDIALCVPQQNLEKFSQEMRIECCPFSDDIGGPFWMLNEDHRTEAKRLQDVAMNGRLSIFIGAGVSIPSGLPSWGGLLNELSSKTSFTEEQRKSLAELDYLDQPTVLEEELGETFKQEVAKITKGGRYTPAHALLKSFGAPGATTNYDTLYESAASSISESVARLPWESRSLQHGGQNMKSLLKLHGCVEHPESIILSRKDYMRYPDYFQALRGRLQGMFLTSEILFVGFSMTDDNVHKIIDQCRKVLYVDGKPKFKMGTILELKENEMFSRLWDQDFHVITFGTSWNDNLAWRLDCFLDLLASEIASKRQE